MEKMHHVLFYCDVFNFWDIGKTMMGTAEKVTQTRRKRKERINRKREVTDWLFSVLRPAQEYFIYMETSPLPVKGCKIYAIARRSCRAFEQGGVFIVPHLLWHGASVFPVSSDGPPHSIASCDSQGDAEDLFLPGSSRVPIESPLTTRKGVLRTYSYLDPLWSKEKWNL
jgi:hypothetical protein